MSSPTIPVCECHWVLARIWLSFMFFSVVLGLASEVLHLSGRHSSTNYVSDSGYIFLPLETQSMFYASYNENDGNISFLTVDEKKLRNKC